MGSYRVMGIEFQFYQMKRVMRVVVMVANNVNVFNTTKLYT